MKRADWAQSLCHGTVAGAVMAVLGISVHAFFGPQAASLASSAREPAGMASNMPRAGAGIRLAKIGNAAVSADARHVADWVADSRDNAHSSFVIVDKKQAQVLVFDQDARLVASTPVLLGGTRGDDSVPGIGSRPVVDVRPEERTTPAGRFVGQRGLNMLGEDVVWVDYEAAVSMHRVRTTNPAERRLERLATPTIDDNRISYGCINVPVAFFESQIAPLFATRRAIVYVLPDVKPLHEVFGSYDVAARHGLVPESDGAELAAHGAVAQALGLPSL